MALIQKFTPKVDKEGLASSQKLEKMKRWFPVWVNVPGMQLGFWLIQPIFTWLLAVSANIQLAPG